MTNRKLIAILLAMVFLSACSTLPRRIHPPEKKDADQSLSLAQKLELNLRFEDADLMYKATLKKYRALPR
ncbi:MAG: hypothetical protein U1C33_02150 [Candidatus Cloacimonadaceae bacterium]|nr:hypothetical protein [Candidatus Cloacimonadaceae bacterium]